MASQQPGGPPGGPSKKRPPYSTNFSKPVPNASMTANVPEFVPLPSGTGPRYVPSPVWPASFEAPVRPQSSASNKSNSSFLTQLHYPSNTPFNFNNLPPGTQLSRLSGQQQHPPQKSNYGNASQCSYVVSDTNTMYSMYGSSAYNMPPQPTFPNNNALVPQAVPQALPQTQLVPYGALQQQNRARNTADLIKTGDYETGGNDIEQGIYSRYGLGSRHTSNSGIVARGNQFSAKDTMGGQAQLLQKAPQAPPAYAPAGATSVMYDIVAPPTWFNAVAHGKPPTIDQAFKDMPLAQLFLEKSGPSTAGVLKISNIPYSSFRSEMVAIFGRSARLLQQPEGSPFYAIHIIMERMSGKTTECYVEVPTPDNAARMIDLFNQRIAGRRHPKIGDRNVDVSMSSQQELMNALFPRAKYVRFDVNGVPEVHETIEVYGPGICAAGFQGFLMVDEIHLLVKHAESPIHSPFVQRVPHRPYECMISTLNKYPWYDTKHVFLGERKLLFEATNSMLKCLATTLHRLNVPPGFSLALLQELAAAAMTCPGFGEKQKHAFANTLNAFGYGAIAAGSGSNVKFGGLHKYAATWPFLTLTKSLRARDDFVDYYIDLFRRAAGPSMNFMSIQDIMDRHRGTGGTDAFAELKIDYKTNDMGTLTLHDATKRELKAVSELLAAILPPTPMR